MNYFRLSPLRAVRSPIVAAVLGLLALLTTSCTVYQVAPGEYSPVPPAASFDRSWNAALGAFADQGVRVLSEDRGSGVLRGTRDGIDVTASVRSQADGSVRVEFNTSGATARDPDLINRVSRAYDRRMGR